MGRLNHPMAQRVGDTVGNGALAQVPGRVDWTEILAIKTTMY